MFYDISFFLPFNGNEQLCIPQVDIYKHQSPNPKGTEKTINEEVNCPHIEVLVIGISNEEFKQYDKRIIKETTIGQSEVP